MAVNDAIPTPVIDPTENVKDLVKEVVIRFEQLREADQRLAESELRRTNDIAEIRAAHARELANAEAKRIDAIRSVDVAAVGIANERAIAQAAVLAQQVATSAEQSRIQVTQTATTIQQQFDQTTKQLSDRVTLLEKSQYEGMGRSGLSTPLLATLVAIVAGIIGFALQGLLTP